MMTKIRFIKSILLLSLLPLAIFVHSSSAQSLPTQTSNLFSGSGNCTLCHSASQGVFVTQSGEDISPLSLWQSTMMANASRDPLWQAKVTAEIAENPALKEIIEDKCTTCHAPMGRTEAVYNGAGAFTFAAAMADPLSLDGVSCTLCHQIQKENFGTPPSFSGHYQITNVHEIYGPYASPTTMPMFNQTGYTPTYSQHVNQSELCATCHTLFTPYVDNTGQVAGELPEQTPYLEWKNSIYPARNTECQTCHMPAVDEAMKITSRPSWLTTQRTPIYKHDFVGANVFVLTLINDNITEIGATTTEEHFGITIAKAKTMLQKQTAEIIVEPSQVADTLFADVTVKNLSGHKFPTGFPSRRAWIHLLVADQTGKVLFESGKWDETGEIIGLDEMYEPHHDIITNGNQVQIYQTLMQDVDDQVTYTLLRGARYVKDNRLPPQGFKTSHADYESIKISGLAESDANFNRDESGAEGSGTDRIRYKISLPPTAGEMTITAELYYQTISPRFAQDLLNHQTDQVTKFKAFYDSAGKAPIQLQSVSKTVVNTSVGHRQDNFPAEYGLLGSYPNPFNSKTTIRYRIPKKGFSSLEISNMLGRTIKKLLAKSVQPGEYRIIWDGTDDSGAAVSSGIYIVSLRTENNVENARLLLLR